MPPNPACVDAVRTILAAAEEASTAARDPEQRAGLRLAVARLLHRVGDRDGARRAADGAVAEAGKTDSGEASPLLWPSVVHSLHQIGETATARRLLVDRLDRAWKTQDSEERRNRVLLLLEVAGALGDRALLAQGAVRGRARDPKGFAGDDAREMLAGAWLAAGELDRATSIVATLPKARRAVLLAHVATARIQRGERAAGRALMAKAYPLLAAEPNALSREMNLGIVLRQAVRQGAVTDAVRRAGPNAALRRAVAEALFETGKTEDGLKLGAAARPATVYALAGRGDRARAKDALATVIKEHAYFMQDDVVRMVAAIAAADAKAGDTRAFEEHVAEGRRLAETRDPVFGDNRSSMLLSFAEAMLTGGWRPLPSR